MRASSRGAGSPATVHGTVMSTVAWIMSIMDPEAGSPALDLSCCLPSFANCCCKNGRMFPIAAAAVMVLALSSSVRADGEER